MVLLTHYEGSVDCELPHYRVQRKVLYQLRLKASCVYLRDHLNDGLKVKAHTAYLAVLEFELLLKRRYSPQRFPRQSSVSLLQFFFCLLQRQRLSPSPPLL